MLRRLIPARFATSVHLCALLTSLVPRVGDAGRTRSGCRCLATGSRVLRAPFVKGFPVRRKIDWVIYNPVFRINYCNALIIRGSKKTAPPAPPLRLTAALWQLQPTSVCLCVG